MKNYGLSKRLKSILAVLLCFALLSGSFGVIALGSYEIPEEDDEYNDPCIVHYFVNGVCNACGKRLCEVTGGHQFENNTCIYCGRYDCNYTDEHEYENGVCTICKKHECEITGFHQIDGDVCTLCGRYWCETRNAHYYSDGICSDGICDFCGKHECENTGNHNYDSNGFCTSCGKYECENTGFHQYEGFVCTLCGKYECEITGVHYYENGVCAICRKPMCEITGVHQYDENNVCTACGKTYCEVNGHNFENGVCTACGLHCPHNTYENGVCTVCGAEDPNANPSTGTCTHNFVGGVCTKCGALESGFITPIECPPHFFVNGVCTGCGIYECEYTGNHSFVGRHCEICGMPECSVTGNHNIVDGVCEYCWKYECQITGNHNYENCTCTICGRVDPNSGYSIEPCQHNIQNGVCILCGKLECQITGNHNFVNGACSNCGMILCEDGGHNFENGICTRCNLLCPHSTYENGVCTLCGMTECAVKGHNYENGVCSNCGMTLCEDGRHNFKNGRCTVCGIYECEFADHNYENGVCTVCGKTYCEVNGHDYEEITSYEGTCTDDGWILYECTRCGDWHTETFPGEHCFEGGECIYCDALEPDESYPEPDGAFVLGSNTAVFGDDVYVISKTFTPETRGVYRFTSVSAQDRDPDVVIMFNGAVIASAEYTTDEEAENYNDFLCEVKLDAGRTYTVAVKEETACEARSFTVNIEKLPPHSISVPEDPNPYGSFKVCDASGNEINSAYAGDEVHLVPLAQDGYAVNCWLIYHGNDSDMDEDGVFTMPDSDVFVDANFITGFELAAHNLSLEGDIGVNFYVTAYGANENTYAEFTFRGETTQVPVDLDKYENYNGDKAYRFSFGVAAADIDEPVTCVVVNGPYRSEAYTYSVNQYIDETVVLDDDELRDLMGALGDYGYYANCFFNPGSPFEKAIVSNYESKMDLMTAESLAGFNGADLPSGAGNALTYEGMTLVLRSETAIRYYFTLPEGADTGDYTFKSVAPDNSETQLTPVKKGSMYYVEISDIPSALLGQMYIVQVYAGEELVNFFAGCALTYAYRVISAPGGMSEELVTLCKALAYYEDCARRYFAG